MEEKSRFRHELKYGIRYGQYLALRQRMQTMRMQMQKAVIKLPASILIITKIKHCGKK